MIDLQTLQAPSVVQALNYEAILARNKADLADRLRQATVVAASPRLAEAARRAGFEHVVEAAGPRPAQLVNAACTAIATRIR